MLDLLQQQKNKAYQNKLQESFSYLDIKENHVSEYFCISCIT